MSKSTPKFYSMTGYGQVEKQAGELGISIEIKSVNSRYLDLNLKYPNEYSFLELDLRNLLKQRLQRGRVDVFIRRTSSQSNTKPQINLELFKNYWEAIQGVFKNLNVDSKQLDVTQLSTFILNQNDLFSNKSKVDISEEEKALITEVLTEALNQLLESRSIEGEALIRVVSQHHENLKNIWKIIEVQRSSLVASLAQDLLVKIKNLFLQLDFTSERMEQEVAWRIERSDITEEINRIAVHLASLEAELKGASSGKKIEFLAQELGREFNTISSKVPSAEIQTAVVSAKLEIEKIREQSFNIE